MPGGGGAGNAAAGAVTGLSRQEVEARRAAGHVNLVPSRTSRGYGDIVRANVFTRFNAIVTSLAVLVLVVGHPIDATFAVVMVVNTVIGIVQEVRAKRTLDRLAVLVAPRITVIRDGEPVEVDPSAVVLDDAVRLTAGDQIPVDGEVLEVEGLEVDESSLTGEADPVAKRTGDEVRSGSAVVAGTATVRAARVGQDAWIHRLVAQAKEFTLVRSELRDGIDRLLRVVGWGLGPLGGLLLWSQLRGNDNVRHGLVATTAGIVGLVPQGLILLVSLAMAVAIIRLARHQVLVQELYAVEGLARVDVLCLDKTGTLTTGKFALDEVIAVDVSSDNLTAGLGALVAAERAPTGSTRVLAEHFRPPDDWQVVAHVPFSSARKWSATQFARPAGTWVLGAPEVLLEAIGPDAGATAAQRCAELAALAKRVLLVATTKAPLAEAPQLPTGLRAAGLVVLAEELRPDAPRILGYFADQGVAVKIISGDSAATVAAVGARLGVPGADRAVDLRQVPDDQLAATARTTVVFGRVFPEQKRRLVEALQADGHVVAMTGDGVNDVPALKKADIGIAVDTATPATKAVSQLVLLDGRFDHLPAVVGEGRRVIANMERVSSLFVTKTVYAALFAVVIGISGAAFPFLPRHISLVSDVSIGIPAFLLSFRAASEPSRPGYLRRVLRFAVPAGCLAAAVTLATYWLARAPGFGASLEEARTISTFALTAVALWAVRRLMRPLDRYDVLLLAGLIGIMVAAALVPPVREFYALDWPTVVVTGSAAGVVAGAILAAEVVGNQLLDDPQRRGHVHPPQAP